MVPEELFDDLEIVFDDLKDGKKVNSEKETPRKQANCDVKFLNERANSDKFGMVRAFHYTFKISML